MAVLKAFLKRYSEEKEIPCTKPEDVLKGKKTPSQHVFLTEDEIDRIEAYKPRTEREASVQHQFLIECYMGARTSDVGNINEDNIRNDRIVYVSKKTHVETSVPIHKNLMKHLLAPRKKVSVAYYDKTIKEICRICGITEPTKLFYHGKEQTLPKCEYVSSHTARRSFATNLRLRGVSISEICALMNHNKNEQMTARYICIDTRYLTSHAMSFFK
jgi:integrase